MELLPILVQHYGPTVRIDKLTTLKGDASSRRYHRVHLGGVDGDGSIVVMELPEDAFKSDEAASDGVTDVLPFVNMTEHLRERGVRVPRLFRDATSQGVLLLEDLGDDTLERTIAPLEPSQVCDWYDATIDLLVELHRRMWPIPAGCVAATRSFDTKLLRWELDHYREWGAEARFDSPLPADIRDELDQQFDRLTALIVALPQGFVHRDYQSRNLMVTGASPTLNALAVIDYQDALVGPRIYDLVALLGDSYVELEPAEQERLVARYAAAMELDSAALMREFHLVTVQRKLKDGGRFVFIDRVKGNPSFLPFTEPSVPRVRRSLQALEELAPLAEVLRKVDPDSFG